MDFKEKFKREVIPAMMKKFHFKNPMAVPKIEKIVLNTGFGRLVAGKTKEEQEKILKEISEKIAKITGQKPLFCKARKSISSFKIKEGQIIGAKVTLRKKRMFDFLEKLINIVLPRVRDFSGISLKSFDKKGNLTIGISEITAFPEISLDEVKIPFGVEINICFSGKRKKEQTIEILKLLGFPLKL